MIRFGPAGVPIQCSERSTIGGIRCCKELGLEAMEVEFVRGVMMNEPTAREIKKTAEEFGVTLSVHAPYFINLCSEKLETVRTSIRNIVQSLEAASWMGAAIVVIHPGYYQKLPKEKAYEKAKATLLEIWRKVSYLGKDVFLGAETVGKKSQFGGFEEVLKLCKELDFVVPCIDFAHMHARGDVSIKTEEDYKKIFKRLEEELGSYVKHFHVHFSEINYTEKGERNHLPIGTNNQPPYRPLMRVLAENEYSGTIICESPKLDMDAMKMKAYFEMMR